jgi:uncharacterized membrane protein YbhN (UPF0104 family)
MAFPSQVSRAQADLLRNARLLLKTIALQGGIFLPDALTLWLAFQAIGQTQIPWVVFVSFAIASMVATIGPIPDVWVARRELSRG